MSGNPVPKTEPGQSGGQVATIPDLNALIGRLQALRSDPRMSNLDQCFDLSKRNRIRRLKHKIETEGEQYTETILRIIEQSLDAMEKSLA